MTGPEQGVACAACGALAKPGDRFCGVCGAAILPIPTECAHCGADLREGARFCRRCGKAVGATGPGGGGTRRSGLPLFVGAAAALAMVAGGAYLLVGRGGDDTGPAGNGASTEPHESKLTVTAPANEPGPNGFPQRPAVRLEHPAGAAANVPPGEVVLSDYVDLRQVDIPELGSAWQAIGKGWEFVSLGGVVIEEPVALSIPAAGAPDDARVLALSATGTWIPVPATRNGDAFAVEVSRVPSPWFLAVARPASTAAGPDHPVAEAVAAEALYWSDREAWERQETAWAALQDLSAAALEPSLLVSSGPARVTARTWFDTHKDLDWVVRMLGAVRITLQGSSVIPGAASDALAVQQYRAAISRLAAVRKEWMTYRYTWARDAGNEGDLSLMLYDDGTTMEQAIETMLALYAPWGVDLTLGLLKGGDLDGMDLRVLVPYGEAYFTDVPFARKRLAFVDNAIDKVQFGAGERTEARFLRLYSTRAVESTLLIDYLKDWKTEAFLRYLPIGLWAAGLTTGGPFLVAVTAADQVLSWYQSSIETAGDPYLYATTQAGSTALSGASLYVDATEEAVRTTFVGEFKIKNQALGIAQFVYSAALSYAVANSDWYMLKDVRQVTAGSQSYCIRGSCNWFFAQQIPPIQVIAAVRGPLKQAEAAYPATRSLIMAWNLQTFMTYAGAPNLHGIFVESRSSITDAIITRAINLPELGWEPYVQDRWPDGIVSTQPDLQAIRVGIPRDALNTIAMDYELGPAPDFEDYGLTLRLDAPGGKRNIFILTEEGARLDSDNKDTVYLSVQLAREGFDPAGASSGQIPEVYRGEAQAMDGGVLRTRLTGSLLAHSDESPRLSFEIDFARQPDRIVQVDPEDPEAAKIHLYDASPTAPGNTYRLTTFRVTMDPLDRWYEEARDQWDAGGLAPENIHGCESNPSSCYLVFYTPKGAPAGTIEAALTGPDRNPANGIIVATQVGADAPDGTRWLQFQNDAFFGTYRVDESIDHIFDGRFSGDTLWARVGLRIPIEVDDPQTARNLDGFPVSVVFLVFDAAKVK